MSRLRSLLLLGLVACAGVIVGGDPSEAIPTFAPGGALCFENFNALDYPPDPGVRDAAECDGDPSPSAASDLRTKFCLGWNDDCTVPDAAASDSNFQAVTGFLPAPMFIRPGNEYPVGALSGALSADSSLGLLGNPCNLAIQINFTLMNASTNIDNTIFAGGVGQPDPMFSLAFDGNGNGVPDGADLYPSFLRSAFDVDHTFGPDGIPNTSATPTSDDVNGPIPPLQPIARLFAATKVFGGWVSLNFLVFQPGATVLGPDRTPVQLNPALGYPAVAVLQDPTVPPSPAPVSDFCSALRVRYVTFGTTHDNPCTGVGDTPSTRGNCPSEIFAGILENSGYPLLPCEGQNSVDEDADGKVNDACPQVNALSESGAQCDDNLSNEPNGEDSSINDGCPAVGFGENGHEGSGCTSPNEGACVAHQNPAQAGTGLAVIYARSQRDADGDGIENQLDVCSLKTNAGWNPRSVDATNDVDFDGLPTACDPQPNVAASQSPAGCQMGIVGPDHDQDCYSNRQDSCPTANQLKDPALPPSYTVPPQPTNNLPRMLDRDWDGIGDACDVTTCADKPGYSVGVCQLFGTSQKGTSTSGASSQDGEYATDCLGFEQTVASGAPPRATGPTHNTDPNCAFGPCFDCDGDGFSGVDEEGTPLCGDGRDEDSDTVVDDGCPGGPVQTGAFSEVQFNIGTLDSDPCGNDGWPLDLVGTGTSANKVDISDIGSYIVPHRRYGTKPGDAAFNKRWDISPGRGSQAVIWINVEDLVRFTAGGSAYPAMLSGQRALGRVCPASP
jgi:hypothetical protein